MVHISVITPSIRKEGLSLVEKALKRQSYRDFEWLVDTSNEKLPNDYWGVYKAYNRLIRKSSGDLIVSWQDFTYAKQDTLEKFWFHFTQEPKTIVTAVGNKYEDNTWTVMTWKDPREREDQGTYYQCFYNDIEFNLCSLPKEALVAVGGFDEEMDKYSSLCGLDVVDRLNIIGGWDFKIDQTIKSYSLEHGRLPKWEENLPFNGPYAERRRSYVVNPKLKYLD